MAELCKECFYEIHGENVKEGQKVVMSKENEICEACNHCKQWVVKVENGDKRGILSIVHNFVKFIRKFGI